MDAAALRRLDAAAADWRHRAEGLCRRVSPPCSSSNSTSVRRLVQELKSAPPPQPPTLSMAPLEPLLAVPAAFLADVATRAAPDADLVLHARLLAFRIDAITTTLNERAVAGKAIRDSFQQIKHRAMPDDSALFPRLRFVESIPALPNLAVAADMADADVMALRRALDDASAELSETRRMLEAASELNDNVSHELQDVGLADSAGEKLVLSKVLAEVAARIAFFVEFDDNASGAARHALWPELISSFRNPEHGTSDPSPRRRRKRSRDNAPEDNPGPLSKRPRDRSGNLDTTVMDTPDVQSDPSARDSIRLSQPSKISATPSTPPDERDDESSSSSRTVTPPPPTATARDDAAESSGSQDLLPAGLAPPPASSLQRRSVRDAALDALFAEDEVQGTQMTDLPASEKQTGMNQMAVSFRLSDALSTSTPLPLPQAPPRTVNPPPTTSPPSPLRSFEPSLREPMEIRAARPMLRHTRSANDGLPTPRRPEAAAAAADPRNPSSLSVEPPDSLQHWTAFSRGFLVHEHDADGAPAQGRASRRVLADPGTSLRRTASDLPHTALRSYHPHAHPPPPPAAGSHRFPARRNSTLPSTSAATAAVSDPPAGTSAPPAECLDDNNTAGRPATSAQLDQPAATAAPVGATAAQVVWESVTPERSARRPDAAAAAAAASATAASTKASVAAAPLLPPGGGDGGATARTPARPGDEKALGGGGGGGGVSPLDYFTCPTTG
ncbi:hypothetical protein HK405_004310 [Cladochytrium tenue]|nr:hypothetical protein HK405_004310 [Cladochytrium tenue]